MLVFSFPSWPRGPSDSTPESSNRLRRRIIRFSFWTPVQIKAWNPLKDPPTTQPRSSQNREGRFANTAFLVGEWNRNRFFVIILFWLILFVSRFSRFWIFPLRHLFGSYLYPTPRLTEPDIFPALTSCPTLRLTEPGIFSALASCNILMLLLPEPGTNKRVKSSKRYPLRPRSTSIALIGPYHEPKKSLPLQREDYQFGIEVLGWKVVARGNSFSSRGNGFYLRRANSKICYCNTTCLLYYTNEEPENRAGQSPKSINLLNINIWKNRNGS